MNHGVASGGLIFNRSKPTCRLRSLRLAVCLLGVISVSHESINGVWIFDRSTCRLRSLRWTVSLLGDTSKSQIRLGFIWTMVLFDWTLKYESLIRRKEHEVHLLHLSITQISSHFFQLNNIIQGIPHRSCYTWMSPSCRISNGEQVRVFRPSQNNIFKTASFTLGIPIIWRNLELNRTYLELFEDRCIFL